MSPLRSALAAPAALMLLWLPAYAGQPGAVPSSARTMALLGTEPYAELWEAGVPLPPAPAEVAALSFPTRLQEQSALKAVWLERLIRAREERNRVSRENLSHCMMAAQRLGAPAAFVEMLRRQAAGALPNRERYLLERAQQELLSAYGVDARELRFFVEGCGLSATQLREVALWLPLPALFNVLPPAGEELSSRSLAMNYVEMMAARRDLAAVWRSATDAASAAAAAEASLPLLLRCLSALRVLQSVPDEAQLSGAVAPYAGIAAVVDEAYTRERDRLRRNAWFGSPRLQVLDYLLH